MAETTAPIACARQGACVNDDFGLFGEVNVVGRLIECDIHEPFLVDGIALYFDPPDMAGERLCRIRPEDDLDWLPEAQPPGEPLVNIAAHPYAGRGDQREHGLAGVGHTTKLKIARNHPGVVGNTQRVVGEGRFLERLLRPGGLQCRLGHNHPGLRRGQIGGSDAGGGGGRLCFLDRRKSPPNESGAACRDCGGIAEIRSGALDIGLGLFETGARLCDRRRGDGDLRLDVAGLQLGEHPPEYLLPHIRLHGRNRYRDRAKQDEPGHEPGNGKGKHGGYCPGEMSASVQRALGCFAPVGGNCLFDYWGGGSQRR
jgi:hypothetical protein